MFNAISLSSLAKLGNGFRSKSKTALILFCAIYPISSLQANNAGHEVTTIADNLDFPWSIAFLPNGDHLVAELGGQLLRISADGTTKSMIAGVPDVYRASQGGLFDVVLDPDFAANQTLYLSFAAGSPDQNATTVASARLTDNALDGLKTLFSAAPTKYGPDHYGGRLAWLPDRTLLLTTGDGRDFREQAQDLSTHFGKTIRLMRDGSAPADNPFSNAPFVWSYGHRNPQGLAVRNDGVVFLHEHGPKGGDELNIVEPGKNYGWPAITHGIDYHGGYVSPFTEYEGMEQPIKIWIPSIAPSGLMIYEGDMFPEWQGDLFVGALVDAEVRHLQMDDMTVTGEAAIFPEISGRIRDIRQAPDGSIYVLTDGEGGSVIRVSKNQE